MTKYKLKDKVQIRLAMTNVFSLEYLDAEITEDEWLMVGVKLKDLKETGVFERQVPTEEKIESLAEVEKRMIQASVIRNNGKRKRVARELGVSERTVYRKLKEYGLEVI